MDITPSSRNNRHLVLFNVAPYRFCAPATEVESIIMLPPVSRLPKVPPSVIGLINHRGQVYRVISLRRKLGLETGPPRMEGQLILTSLPTGLTAFLVDEVLDVLPDTNLPRRPLSLHSAMDLFDAFILRDEQILFHTTFHLIDQAAETDYPSPDLKTLERMTAAALAPSTAPDRPTAETAATARDAEETNGGRVPEPTIGREALRPKPAAAKHHVTVPQTKSARPGGVMADRSPTPKDQRPASPELTREKPRPRRLRAAYVSKRARRYALALIAILLLLLIVTFSTSLLLKQSLVVAPPPATAPSKEHPELPQEPGGPPSSSANNSPQTVSPSRTATAPLAEIAASPEVAPAEEPSPRPAIPREETAIIPKEPPESSREILRLETETFTLMVERPAPDQQIPAASLSNQVSPASSAIVHRVVPGDTLWDIAEHYLGDPFQYHALARLSQIRDPDLIYPGDIIRIIKKAP